MNTHHSSTTNSTPKCLSLEQKIRLIARAHRDRERRHRQKPQNHNCRSRHGWLAGACALAVFAVLVLPMASRADETTASFEQGNQSYASGHFADAAHAYEAVIVRQGFSAPVLFNLGNAWLKAGEPGRAILYYERAQWLAPGDRGIATNLRLARQQAGLAVVEQNSLEKAARMLDLNTVAWVGSACLVVLCVGIVGLRLLHSGWRMGARTLTGVAALALVAVAASLAWRWPDLNRVVVLSASTPARIAPADAAGVSFNLSAGEIVHARQTHGAFLLVRTRDGRTGWVSHAHVAPIVASAPDGPAAPRVNASVPSSAHS